ncbi:AAA family ATPase [Bradyrhizobium sp. 159]|uniref:AAA family ATPase n=1 Tax=Bradyrhizobium sp. 159 TaxID=2782632 RepID=UPI002111CDD1|nr:AAA family ATPase [Bradyrhizobium sp. 159]MCK1618924.1 AAA family ATPase [Bradyrhizobium sp. 159]
MDPVRNPYAPGAGTPPPELAGRSELINEATVALRRTQVGRPTQSPILVGLRGVGKTVLLVKINELAEKEGFHTVSVEAHEGKTLPELLAPGLRKVLLTLSAMESAKELGRRGLRVFRSFLNTVKMKIHDVELGLTISPELGAADSGDIESDLPDLMLAIGHAAKAAKRPVALLLDELQYLTDSEFSALIMSIHKLNQNSLPVILIGAGLPQILGLAGTSKSYAERLFKFPEIGALDEKDAINAIVNPARDEGVSFEKAAVHQILNLTERYPYFLQQWAHEAWNVAQGSQIRAKDVVEAHNNAIAVLDEGFFKVRFDRCTPSERKYMRALAELGSGIQRSGDIAHLLKVKTTSVAPTRSSLIKKGMIYSPSHGDTAFTVPLFDQYMKRAIPKSEFDRR